MTVRTNQFDDFARSTSRPRQDAGKQQAAARAALSACQHEEAVAICETALKTPRLRPDQEAAWRCLLAEALENLARFTEAVHALEPFDSDEQRSPLSPAVKAFTALRLASAYGGTTDLPRAIALARQSLALSQQQADSPAIAQSHLLLGTLYRRLGELWFAQDHLSQIINEAPQHQDRLLLAQAYSGLTIVHSLEAEWSKAREAGQQGYEALAELDAPLIRGSLNVNLAAVIALQGKTRESVGLLEQALPLFERARQPRLVVNARSNLGYSLLRLGEMDRAREVLEQALREARSCEALLIAASTMETLGEWHFLQGQFAEALPLIDESLAIIRGLRISFNEAMALLTRGRCLLLNGQREKAAEAFRLSLEVSERMGDPRGVAEAKLSLIEACLSLDAEREAQQLLTETIPLVEQLAHLPLTGRLREMTGLLALSQKQFAEAARYFNQSLSVWELLEDRYRQALMQARLGSTYLPSGDLARAYTALSQAQAEFQALNARPALAETETLLRQLDDLRRAQSAPAEPLQVADPINVIARLLEAGFSRELLLHELTRILHDDFGLTPVIVFQRLVGESPEPLVYRGCHQEQARNLGQTVIGHDSHSHGGTYRVFTIRQGSLWLYLGKREGQLPDSLLDLIVKQLRFSLEYREPAPPGAPPARQPSSLQNDLCPALPGLIYCSEAMRRVVEQVLSLRSSNITVLITGETGTGKELVARAIHAHSARASHPFIPFNCAAAPRELIESQLFGHRRGAFTGATTDFPGVIGAAEKGTLFLDEIGELSREMQPKLLRFLQHNEIHRLGEATPRIADVRVITATNRDLEAMVADGEFRADLYYRLNVIQFHLPPLRERREEIPVLAEHFLARYAKEAGRSEVALPVAVMSLLKQYDWPGNARQLENEMQRLVALTAPGAAISADVLSPHIGGQARLRLVSANSSPAQSHKTLAETVAETERQVLRDALTRHQGNISRIAAELGMSRYGLRNMLRRHDLASPKIAV